VGNVASRGRLRPVITRDCLLMAIIDILVRLPGWLDCVVGISLDLGEDPCLVITAIKVGGFKWCLRVHVSYHRAIWLLILEELIV